MVINFVSALTSFVVGSWLIYTSQTFYTKGNSTPEHQSPPRGMDTINFVQIMLILVGIVAIPIGFVFILNGFDILILLLKDGKEKSCFDFHKQPVKKEMREALGEETQNWTWFELHFTFIVSLIFRFVVN